MHKMFSTFLMILFFGQELLSQADSLPEFPSTREVAPKISVVLEKKDSSFIYYYTVLNDINAQQNIWIFIVESKTVILGITAPFDWRPSSIRRETISASSWSALDSSAMIKPGASLRGFSLVSSGIPGVVSSFSLGYREPPEGEFEFKQGTNDVFYNSRRVLTVGPVPRQASFSVSLFLDTLISYKHQALDLGWIKDKGIANSLDQKLDNAKAQLSKNNKTSAKNILQAFINEVDAQRDKHLTSEAYALLKFNAEYLVSKLTQ